MDPFSFTLDVETDIIAPRPLVWQVLTDFAAYAAWNPFVLKAQGTATVGSTIQVETLLGDQVRQITQKVTESVSPSRFTWIDTGWFTVAAKGTHSRTLTATEAGTHVVQRIVVTGVAAGLAMWQDGVAMQKGLDAELFALKLRAEALARQSESD